MKWKVCRTAQQPPEPNTEPQSRYTSGQIKIRNSDGTETRGVLTGYVDENGNHEYYYVEGDLQHLHYASEHELDNILSEYQPDEPQQPSAAEQPQAAERVYPEGVTDTEAYDNGLEDEPPQLRYKSDEELNNNIARFSDESEVSSLTDHGRGWVEGLKQEQQRRIQAAQPEQDAPIEPTPAPAHTPESRPPHLRPNLRKHSPRSRRAMSVCRQVSILLALSPVPSTRRQHTHIHRWQGMPKIIISLLTTVASCGRMTATAMPCNRIHPEPTYRHGPMSSSLLGAVQSANEQPSTVPQSARKRSHFCGNTPKSYGKSRFTR